MRLFMSFKMAVQSIISNKVRSMLTMLGIIIGVLAVIIMVNLVNASMMGMREWMDRMGDNIIQANVYSRGTRSVAPSDLEKLAKENPDIILYTSPVLESYKTVKNSNRNFNGSCYGVSEHFGDIQKMKMAYGSFFSRSEVDSRASVAVIGEYVRQKLFGSRNPVGQTIKISGEVFTVVGVCEQINDELTEWGADARVMIPYTRAMRLFKDTNISEYYISSTSSDTAKAAQEKVEECFRTILKNDNFWVYNEAENLQEMNKEINGLTLLAAAIAGISLLVGGIGIMNIMLVTVTERTHEIGIRKAVGAKTRTILTQFLIESASISCLGGLIGIGLGIVVSEFATMLMDLPSVPMVDQMPIISISFGFSALIGVFFGFYPAFKAARMNPIDALRHE